jgi:ABC-type multidrug transport system permease subunit
MEDLKRKARTNSFYISLTYLGIGTSLLFISVGNTNDLVVIVYSILLLLTLPVTFISWGITYSEADRPILLILGIQVIFFLVFLLIVYGHLLKKYKRDKKLINSGEREF